jgi:peptidyl-prolyl cis-trans isomerase A (cyclophilin A)
LTPNTYLLDYVLRLNMPSKKLTAQKRDELKKKKQKQLQKKSSGFPSIIFLFVIIIVGIFAAYIVLSNQSDQEINGQTSILTAVQDFYVVPNMANFYRLEALNNDISKENSVINIINITTPFSGEAEIMDGLTIKYIPDNNYSGYDEIVYTISDGESESTSAVSIWVADENPFAIIDTTMGTIVVELFEDKVPITARNFINLAFQGYYDGVTFHRVIKEFMIQGGDPTGTGMGGHAAEYIEGYGDPDDPDTWVIPDEFHDDLKHNIGGILSMANSGPDTGGSQFFITVNRTQRLDGKHAIFGRVMMGIDTLQSISEVKTDSNDKPLIDVVINSITIENVRWF